MIPREPHIASESNSMVHNRAGDVDASPVPVEGNCVTPPLLPVPEVGDGVLVAVAVAFGLPGSGPPPAEFVGVIPAGVVAVGPSGDVAVAVGSSGEVAVAVAVGTSE